MRPVLSSFVSISPMRSCSNTSIRCVSVNLNYLKPLHYNSVHISVCVLIHLVKWRRIKRSVAEVPWSIYSMCSRWSRKSTRRRPSIGATLSLSTIKMFLISSRRCCSSKSSLLELIHLTSLRLKSVRILPGVRSKVELSPYDSTKGRITSRLRASSNIG